MSELEVRIPLPRTVRTKELDIKLESTSLRVQLKGFPEPILDGVLTNRIKVDDCMWTLDNGKTVVLQLAKFQKQEWWKTVLEGDVEIDLSKVIPEDSKLDDLDGETRKTVEKMMYDQRQKQLGLPTSEDQNKNELLKNFMAQHPEMDFSQAKFS